MFFNSAAEKETLLYLSQYSGWFEGSLEDVLVCGRIVNNVHTPVQASFS